MDDKNSIFEAGRAFLLRDGRLLERRLFATLWEGAPAAGVAEALRGYRNADGGFGHGLEPDKLCPDSLPVDVELALQAMDAAGAVDRAMVAAACDFLQAVSTGGAVPLAFPVIEACPRAEHWSAWTYEPGVLPTAGLAGLLHKLGVDHAWRDAATEYCWTSIEAGLPKDAHALGEVLVFLEHVPDTDRADRFEDAIRAALRDASSFREDPEDPSYGLTPLHFAPTPASRWRSLFDDAVLEAHLDRLEADQQPDGRWPLTWKPPSAAATLAWQGMETLRALRVLAAYGRLER